MLGLQGMNIFKVLNKPGMIALLKSLLWIKMVFRDHQNYFL